jgi:hypothetical protein
MTSIATSSMNRRVFLGGTVGLGAALVFPRVGRAAPSEPHFFLQVLISGGADPTYLLDARSLEMTAARLQQNYLGKEPTPWVGSNGGSTLAAEPAAALRPFQSDLAVLNGVIMSPVFDGHAENTNMLLTGNPFGGQSFISQLNTGLPLDYLRRGDFFAALDDARFVPLSAPETAEIQSLLASESSVDDDVDVWVGSRYAEGAQGKTRWARGAKSLSDALTQSQVLKQGLAAVKLNPGAMGLKAELELIGEFFRVGLSKSALIDLAPPNAELDVHDAQGAGRQVPLYVQLARDLAAVFTHLKSTPYDATRSLFEVTTVMVASEFGRTMRQNSDVTRTGTDHNALSNSILLAGKGIRGGTVIGASDFVTPNETLSAYHLAKDPMKLRVIGRPIDKVTGLPTSALPSEYAPGDLLTVGSVVNTVYSLFGVAPALFWPSGRGLPAAAAVNALLK